MIEIEKKYLINLPLKETFEFISNPENDSKWMSSCLGVDIFNEDTYDVTFKFFGKKIKFGIKTQTEHLKNHVYETTSGPLSFKGSYSLEPAEGGTMVQWNFSADPGKFFGLVPQVILKKALDKQADDDIKALKKVISNG